MTFVFSPADRLRGLRGVRALILFCVSAWYLSSLFQLSHEAFWKNGLGDWMDPYFINFLLEHWHHSVWTLTDPSSPPMFYPARGTLGNSHALVLYAPLYLATRMFLGPFQAYSLMLLLVLEIGIICLYLVCRSCFRLSWLESVLLTAFFSTSQNVVSGFIGVWSQRASVFLIPPMLLISCAALRMAEGRSRVVLGWLAGLLWMLLFTQDFYTGQFALLFVALGLAAPALIEQRVRNRFTALWPSERSIGAKAAFLVAASAVAWTMYIWLFGGGTLQVFGIRVASHDWRRSAFVALAGCAAFVWLRGGINIKTFVPRSRSWLAFGGGAVAGGLVFLWIYLGPYLQHQGFPEEQLLSSLMQRNPANWHHLSDILRDLHTYDTLRSFTLVVVLALLAWVPWLKVDRNTRLYCVWFLCVSLLVLVIPIRFNEFSIWRTFFAPLPGFSAIRDPKRIIYLYELAVVLATALFLSRLPRNSLLRMSTTVLLLVLLIAERNHVVLDFLRPNDAFGRWIEAPIDVDSSCQSFFVKAASGGYPERPGAPAALYDLDAMFVALNHSIPTLNGYSAWSPAGWDLFNPTATTYLHGVEAWITQQHLTGVCAFDIERRTMRPYRSALTAR